MSNKSLGVYKKILSLLGQQTKIASLDFCVVPLLRIMIDCSFKYKGLALICAVSG